MFETFSSLFPLEMTELSTNTGGSSISQEEMQNFRMRLNYYGLAWNDFSNILLGQNPSYTVTCTLWSHSYKMCYTYKTVDSYPWECSHESLSSFLTNSWHVSLDYLLICLLVLCTHFSPECTVQGCTQVKPPQHHTNSCLFTQHVNMLWVPFTVTRLPLDL